MTEVRSNIPSGLVRGECLRPSSGRSPSRTCKKNEFSSINFYLPAFSYRVVSYTGTWGKGYWIGVCVCVCFFVRSSFCRWKKRKEIITYSRVRYLVVDLYTDNTYVRVCIVSNVRNTKRAILWCLFRCGYRSSRLRRSKWNCGGGCRCGGCCRSRRRHTASYNRLAHRYNRFIDAATTRRSTMASVYRRYVSYPSNAYATSYVATRYVCIIHAYLHFWVLNVERTLVRTFLSSWSNARRYAAFTDVLEYPE